MKGTMGLTKEYVRIQQASSLVLRISLCLCWQITWWFPSALTFLFNTPMSILNF